MACRGGSGGDVQKVSGGKTSAWRAQHLHC